MGVGNVLPKPQKESESRIFYFQSKFIIIIKKSGSGKFGPKKREVGILVPKRIYVWISE